MQRTVRKAKPKIRRGIPEGLVKGFILLLLLLGAAYLVIRFVPGFRPYHTLETESMVRLGESENPGAGTAVFDEGYIRYSSFGLSYLDPGGEELWNKSALLETPKLVVRGKYGAIGDLSGEKLLIFDRSGILGELDFNNTLMGFDLSAHGVAVAALDEGETSRIVFYESNGTPVDLSMTLEMSLTGCPVDLALSPEGEGLLISASTVVSGELRTRLAFYNFSVGKGQSSRLVGYFDYPNEMFPQVEYLNEFSAAAAGTDRMLIFSLSRADQPEVVVEDDFSGTLQAVVFGNERLAYAVSDANGGSLAVKSYTAGGKQLVDLTLEDSCRYLALGEKRLLMLGTEKLFVWDDKGKTRFSGEMPFEEAKAWPEGSRELIEIDGNTLYLYRMK